MDDGPFSAGIDRVAAEPRWRSVFTADEIAVGRDRAFMADLLVLLKYGPQSRSAVSEWIAGSMWAAAHRDTASDPVLELLSEEERDSVVNGMKLGQYLEWAWTAVPDIESRMYGDPVHLYALIGALHRKSATTWHIPNRTDAATHQLRRLEAEVALADPKKPADRYLEASGSDADEEEPRRVRIEILAELLSPWFSHGPLNPRALKAAMEGRLDFHWADER